MRVARLASERSRLDTGDLELEINFQVQRLTSMLRTASRRVELARATVGFANQNLEAEKARFSVGRSTNNDVLLRQQELKTAEIAGRPGHGRPPGRRDQPERHHRRAAGTLPPGPEGHLSQSTRQPSAPDDDAQVLSGAGVVPPVGDRSGPADHTSCTRRPGRPAPPAPRAPPVPAPALAADRCGASLPGAPARRRLRRPARAPFETPPPPPAPPRSSRRRCGAHRRPQIRGPRCRKPAPSPAPPS